MSYYGSRFGGSGFSMFPPVIKWLLVVNVAIFVMDFVLLPAMRAGVMLRGADFMPISQFFGALWPVGSDPFWPWQYFSYMFFHGGFTHIFFNMLALWMFGMELEQMWGSKRFLFYYLLCGLGAGVIHSIVTMLMGGGGPTIGASGAIMGVIIAFGFSFPDRMIFLFFFLPLPAKYAVLVIAGLDLYAGVSGSPDGVAHFAHLGGALIGYILLKMGQGNIPLPNLGSSTPVGRADGPKVFTFDRSPRRTQDPRVIDVRFRDVQNKAQRQPAPTMNFGADQARIDEILDKISVSGYQNLTEEEKTILQEASKKMR